MFPFSLTCILAQGIFSFYKGIYPNAVRICSFSASFSKLLMGARGVQALTHLCPCRHCPVDEL